jgi:hypothetical protein
MRTRNPFFFALAICAAQSIVSGCVYSFSGFFPKELRKTHVKL